MRSVCWLHQAQHAPVRSASDKRQVDHGLDKAGQHGQRRADLVRDVGHEVAPHGVGALALGDVLRQHQPHAHRHRAHQHRQGAWTGGPGNCDRLVELRPPAGSHEGRRAHQVGHPLAAVAHGIEAEVVAATALHQSIWLVGSRAAGRRSAKPRSQTGTAQPLALLLTTCGRAAAQGARCGSRVRPRSRHQPRRRSPAAAQPAIRRSPRNASSQECQRHARDHTRQSRGPGSRQRPPSSRPCRRRPPGQPATSRLMAPTRACVPALRRSERPPAAQPVALRRARSRS
jgi:hypothetical protein